MDLIGFFLAVGIFQGVLLAGVLIFAPTQHRQANAFMAGLVFVIALSLAQIWLTKSGFFYQQPALWVLIPFMYFCWGPLIYLYARSLMHGQLSRLDVLHFAPFIVLTLLAASSFWGYETEQQRHFLEYVWSPKTDPELQQQVSGMLSTFWSVWIDWHLRGSLFAAHFGVYCVLVLLLVRQHNLSIVQHFSSLERINLLWLRNLSIACLVFVVLFLLLNRTQVILVGYFNTDELLPSSPFIFLVLLVYGIGMSAVFQSSVIRGEDTSAANTELTEDDIDEAVEDADQQKKYRRSGLTAADAQQYKNQLISAMVEEKHYLDCDLTLPDLAHSVDLSPQVVSQVINEQIGQSFFAFVSSYRIDMAKQMLSDPQTSTMPIVELALEVGFKSKSSFYSAFKKFTDLTPTQYKSSLEPSPK